MPPLLAPECANITKRRQKSDAKPILQVQRVNRDLVFFRAPRRAVDKHHDGSVEHIPATGGFTWLYFHESNMSLCGGIKMLEKVARGFQLTVEQGVVSAPLADTPTVFKIWDLS